MEVIQHYKAPVDLAAAAARAPAGRVERWLGRPLTARVAAAGAFVFAASAGSPAGLAIGLLFYLWIELLLRRKGLAEGEVDARSAEALQRTAWLTAVTGLSPNGVLVFERGADGLHRLVFTNPALSNWFGLRPEDLIGLTEEAVDEWLGGLAPEDRPMPPLAAGDTTLALAGPPLRVLRRGMREGDRHRVHYFRDVTHETAVETLKNEFLTTAAHELRTPLASVYGFAELLQSDRLEPTRQKRAAEIIYRQAGVLKHLVDELLDLARIDAGRGRDFAVERCDLRQVAQRAAETLHKPDERSRIHVEAGGQPVWTEVDPAKLQQALVNVLSNALKYSQPPAAVSLSLQAQPRDGRDGVLVRVVDAGIGMTVEQCDRAFERFYRADTSGHVLGAGLGLAIVREIVELHRGTVSLHSTPGAGTQVTIWLPVSAEAAEAASATDAAATPEARLVDTTSTA